MNHEIAVFRKEHFNAAHRLNNPEWSEDQNREIFGKCNNPNFHGHNYILIVKVVGKIDPVTGYVIDMKTLSSIIKNEILNRFDHKNLNLDCIEFSSLNPSAENIAVVIYNILSSKINPDLKLQVKLYETENNFVEYPAHI
jgi:6-pyruvoyltetrahydropterin/6-carboxytetrahydropterin synthase